ncbi:MAG: NlpC/P60 family protein [Guyparkeria sp.]
MTPADPERVVTAARGWLGTPYHDQASLKGVGCDCLGLIRGVWREVVGPETFTIPPYSRDWGEIAARELIADAARAAMIEIDTDQAQPGAVVMFRMTPRTIAKHLGVMTAPGSFVHSYERLGVIEEPLTQSWARKIAFAFLFPKEV